MSATFPMFTFHLNLTLSELAALQRRAQQAEAECRFDALRNSLELTLINLRRNKMLHRFTFILADTHFIVSSVTVKYEPDQGQRDLVYQLLSEASELAKDRGEKLIVEYVCVPLKKHFP